MTADKQPFTIGEVRMVVTKDEDGNECLPAVLSPDGQWMPLIAADPARFEFVEREAGIIAKATGQTLTIIKLSHREVLGFIAPFGDEAVSMTIRRPQ